jgi:YD repeat-containing protein
LRPIADGNVTATTNALGRVTASSWYDADGDAVAVEDPDDNVTTSVCNGLDQATQSSQGGSGWTGTGARPEKGRVERWRGGVGFGIFWVRVSPSVSQ